MKKFYFVLFSFAFLWSGGVQAGNEKPANSSSANGNTNVENYRNGIDGSYEDLQKIVSLIKDSVNIIFFLVAISITILSYLQARKTVFSPLKTEVFKAQLKVMEEIINRFQNKSILELESDFDFNTIINLNANKMFIEFIELFFKDGIKPTEEFLKELDELSYGGVISIENLEKHFKPVGLRNVDVKEDLVEDEEFDNADFSPLDKWKEYECFQVLYTKKFNDTINEMDSYQNSPLIPIKLKTLLKEYSETALFNLGVIRDVLVEIAQTLPEEFTEVDHVKQFTTASIVNNFNRKKKDFSVKSDEILSFISIHLNIDSILNPRK
ncbi:hypothetical protein [uncultured Serratia sp.]|uniref:hypothetical protein n=1 Tax=uncultured Serratia sp. TaxID=239175 RepID=UPI002585F116|nr:hypothetical protein [uncultured Serratia sp.]